MKNKKGIASIIIAITFIAALITILTATGIINLENAVASITGSGSYIERPVFKYVKCEAIGSLKYSAPTTLGQNGQWLPSPSATNQYEVKLTTQKSYSVNAYFQYSVCNSQVESDSNCRIFQRKIFVRRGYPVLETISGIRFEEKVFVKFGQDSLFGYRDYSNDVKYQIGFIPYGLREYNVLGGSSQQINPNSCEVSINDDSWKDRFLSTNADKVDNAISKNVNERILQPEEVRWYVAGYVTSAAPSFALRYSGKDAWCRPTGISGEIYQINTVQVASGTYKIASVDWSDYLGSENCCPESTLGDKVCNDNFKWVQVAGSQCGAFKSCGSPDWTPYSEKTLIKYSCVNGYCESETKDVECANDYDCKDKNEVCDLSTYTCVDANVNLDGQEIVTIPDNIADCERKGGSWITKTSEEKNILTFIGLKEPAVIVEEYCELKKPFNYALWIAIGIIVFVVFIFRNQLLMGLRFILAKIGVKI